MNNYMKKITLLAVLLFSVIALTACAFQNDRWGNITNDVYLSANGHTITNRDLWDTFRFDAHLNIREWLDETIVADEIVEVQAIIDAYVLNPLQFEEGSEELRVIEWLETNAVQAIFGQVDFNSLNRMQFNQRLIRIQSFLDSLLILNRGVDITGLDVALLNALENWLENYDEAAEEWQLFKLPAIALEQYKVRAAQSLFAWRLFLEEDFADEEGNFYISERVLVNNFRNSIMGRFDVEAFIVRFQNANEANSALRHPDVNIKSTSRGEWVVLPDPRFMSDADFNSGDYAHVRAILSDLNITRRPFDPNNPNARRISEDQFRQFYDRYSISTSRTDGRPDVILTPEQVLEKFVIMYNIVEGASLTPETAITRYEFNAQIFLLNSALRSHIYNTLSLDPDSSNRQYSPRIQTFGNSVYLVFKFADFKPQFEDEIIITITNEDGDEEEVFNLDGLNPETLELDDYSTDRAAAAQAARDKAFVNVRDTRFNDRYVQDRLNEIFEENNPVIFDRTVAVFFAHNHPQFNLGRQRNNNNNLLATFMGYQLLVDDVFKAMEEIRGTSAALDLIFTEIIRDEYASEITADEIRDFRDQFRTIISNFSNNQLAGSGYPASMGRQNFLLLAFGARNNAEAIDNMFVVPRLRDLFFADFEAHYGAGIFEKFATLAALQHENFMSITSSHLLVSVDFDNTGSPQNPLHAFGLTQRPGTTLEDPVNNNDPSAIAELRALEDLIVTLMRNVYNRIGDFISIDAAMEAIVNEFNAVNRVAPTPRPGDLLDVTNPYDALFRQAKVAGLSLRFESLPAITNITNIPSAQQFDQVFFNRIVHLSGEMLEFVNQDGVIPGDVGIFPFLDSYNSVDGQAAEINNVLVDQVRSAFGWHFINVTRVGSPVSARLLRSNTDGDSDYISEFTDFFGNRLEAYNNNHTLTAAQIQIFLEESADEYGIQSLPSDVVAAINAFFNPIRTRYESAEMQRELLVRHVLDIHGGQFANANLVEQSNLVREINRRQIDEYNTLPGLEATDTWNALWGNWWTILESSNIMAQNITHIIGSDAPDFLANVVVIDSTNSEVDTVISYDISGVNLDVRGVYNVTYTATVNGLVIQITVTIHVMIELDPEADTDDTAPTLNIIGRVNPNDRVFVDVALGASQQDLLDAIWRVIVDATDLHGTGETQIGDGDLTSQINIDTRFVNLNRATTSGGYIVILTVTDSSGNQTVQSINVRVNA